MNPLAREANDLIAAVNPNVLKMLSALGKELFFPKGILTQSAEAKKSAHKFNATIGAAMEDGQAMNLECVMRYIVGISPSDSLLYAPSPGTPDLRDAWRKKVLRDNPSLQGKPFGQPVVTNGLTHGLSLVGDLFVEPGDVVLLPDKMWGNYRLIYAVRRGADIRQYAFFKGDGLDLGAFRSALKSACAEKGKAVVLLNFPNNPTGYSPTEAESAGMAEALVAEAEAGANVVVVTDDAYFGLVYEEGFIRESPFVHLAGAHPRLMAVKADAATKEAFVWGLRVGFMSFSVGGAEDGSPLYDALNAKAGGAIRGSMSNCCRLSQEIVRRALESGDFYGQRAQKAEVLKRRALKVKEALAAPKFADAWTPYPFNSGYFMCLRLNTVNAESLRTHLLNKYGVGTISIGDTDLRIAFSSVEEGDIPELFELVYQAAKDLV